MKVRASTLPCGCKVHGPRYVSMCDNHQREFNEIHARWAAERAAGNLGGTFIHTTKENHDAR